MFFTDTVTAYVLVPVEATESPEYDAVKEYERPKPNSKRGAMLCWSKYW